MPSDPITNTKPEMSVGSPKKSITVDSNLLTAATGGGILFVGTLIGNMSRIPLGIILARDLGPSKFGLYQLAVSAVIIFSNLTLLGLAKALVRYVSIYKSRRDTEGLWGALQFGVGLPTIVSVCVGIGLFVFAVPFADIVFKELNLVPLLRIAGLVIPFWTMVSVITAAVRGFKGMNYDAVANRICQPMFRFLLIALLAVTIGLTPVTAFVCFGISVFATVVILIYWLNRLFPLMRSIKEARLDLKKILGFALPVFASDFIMTIGPNLKLFLIGALSSTASTGIFGSIIEISIVGQWIHTALALASAPTVAELHDQKSKAQLKIFYQTTSRWVFTISLPVFLVILMFPEPILSVFGEQFIVGAAALRIMAFAGLTSVGIGITYTLITMTGNAVLKLVNSIVMYATMLSLDILLIPTYGVMGAAIASLTAVSVVSVLSLVEVWIIFKTLPFSLNFMKPLIGGLVAISVAIAMDFLLAEKALWTKTAFSALSLFIVYATSIALLGFSKEDRSILHHINERIVSFFKL